MPINGEIIATIVFVVFLIVFLLLKRKNIVLQKLIFPLLYLILYRSNFGIKFMQKFAAKYREWIKFFGYCCIGLSIVGMIFISVSIISMIWNILFAATPQPGVALVLPFTNVPGIGFLSFSHWIIAIFILALVHEFAHGIVAAAHGLRIKSSGFAFFAIIVPIIPAAYVEPDEKQLQKESDIVQYSVFAAGPIINIVVALLILIAFPYVANPARLAPFEATITEPVGFSFNVIEGDYPVVNAGIEPGIISSVNGETVENFVSFIEITYGVRPGDTITITTEKGDYSLKAVASPDNPKRGFIGIQPIANERVAKPEYESIKGTYDWFKGLFKWLFLLNLFIGLFNLLPLGIVDGGRILKTFLSKVMKNQIKANKLWGFISFFFLALLLIGLISTYAGKFF